MKESAVDRRIVDVSEAGDRLVEDLAKLSYSAFREHAPNWLPTLDAAREEVLESLETDRRSRAMVEPSGRPIGWIGVIPHSRGRVWEIHPIAIRPDRQGRGYGRLLVDDIERQARSQGVLTLFAGTGDNRGMTSLASTAFYSDPLSAIRSLTCDAPHAYKFWLRMGFHVVGVMPNEEGAGYHGIHLAKPLATGTSKSSFEDAL